MPSVASVTFDGVSFLLAFGALVHIGWSILESGLLESIQLLAANPLLGGDPRLSDNLPIWTYMVGHILPGLVLQLLGTLFATFVSREWRFAPRHDFKAAILTVVALAGSGILLAPLHKMMYEQKIGQLYFDIDKYSYSWVLISIILALLITETWFFWIHLALHQKTLYKYIHGVHHSFNPSTSACASAFHPLDIFILAMGAMLVPVLVPIHNGVYSGTLLVNLLSTVLQHTATRTSFSMGVFNDPNLHNIHHDYGRKPKNLGSILCIWDRVVGTYEPNVPKWVKRKQEKSQ